MLRSLPVFDEVHFGNFVDNYITGQYLFDIHPPLGKLTLAAAAKLGGYKSQNFSFEQIGTPFGDVVYLPQRALAALVGSLIPPVMFLTGRALDLSVLVSVTAGAAAVFDNLLCIESRLILTDSQLIFFVQAALLCALKLWATPKSTPRRYMWLLLTAVFGGCAISTKWTALVAPGLIAVVSLTGLVFPVEGMLDVLEMAVAGVVALSIYVGCFWLHFKLLPRSGAGDAFMAMDFRKTLIGSPQYDSKVEKPSFSVLFRYLNWEMLRANKDIKTRHPWETKWYEWLYNARGVLYLDEEVDGGKQERVYLLSNPALPIITGLGVIACIIIVIVTPIVYMRTKKRMAASEQLPEVLGQLRKRWGVILFFLFGWIANLMPYIGIERCTFLYHVLPAQQIGSILTMIALEQLPTKLKIRQTACIIVIVSLGAAFYHWRAWTYALPRTIAEHEKLQWMPRWT